MHQNSLKYKVIEMKFLESTYNISPNKFFKIFDIKYLKPSNDFISLNSWTKFCLNSKMVVRMKFCCLRLTTEYNENMPLKLVFKLNKRLYCLSMKSTFEQLTIKLFYLRE